MKRDELEPTKRVLLESLLEIFLVRLEEMLFFKDTSTFSALTSEWSWLINRREE